MLHSFLTQLPVVAVADVVVPVAVVDVLDVTVFEGA